MEQVIKAAEENPDERLGVDYDGRYRGKNGPTYAELLKDAQAGTIKPEKAYNIIKHDRDIIRKRAEAEAAAAALVISLLLLLPLLSSYRHYKSHET